MHTSERCQDHGAMAGRGGGDPESEGGEDHRAIIGHRTRRPRRSQGEEGDLRESGARITGRSKITGRGGEIPVA
eukprot:4455427-Pyramimonas_sp.AAC.1